MQQALYNNSNDTFSNNSNDTFSTDSIGIPNADQTQNADQAANTGATTSRSATLLRWATRKWDLVGVLMLIGSSAAYGVFALAHVGL